MEEDTKRHGQHTLMNATDWDSFPIMCLTTNTERYLEFHILGLLSFCCD